jgi:hypothetical protein
LVWFAKAEKESNVCRKERDDDGVRVYVAEMARVPTERVFVRRGFLLPRRKTMCIEKRKDDDGVRLFVAGDQSI